MIRICSNPTLLSLLLGGAVGSNRGVLASAVTVIFMRGFEIYAIHQVTDIILAHVGQEINRLLVPCEEIASPL